MQSFDEYVADLAHSDDSVVSKSVRDVVGVTELHTLVDNLNVEGLKVDRLTSSAVVGDFINTPHFSLWGAAYDGDDNDYRFCAKWLLGVDGWVLDDIHISDSDY